MTPVWRRRSEATRQQFVDDFVQLGFEDVTPSGSERLHLKGTIKIPRDTGPDLPHPVIVEVHPDHPFHPPTVRYANPPTRLTWHLEPGGVFCLWHRGNHSSLEWTTAQSVVERIRLWWKNRNEDWPHDAGALDLVHYFGSRGDTLYTYASSSDLFGEATLTKCGEGWYHWTRLVRSGGRDEQFRKRAMRRHVAEAVDIGTLIDPVWDWPTIAARLDQRCRQSLEKRIRSKGSGFVLLRYRRPGPDGEREGILGLDVLYREPDFVVSAVETAEHNDSVLSHRAGPDHTELAGQSAMIVGVGAVGSFVADQLARAGIGHLTIIDHDRLRPGNSTRHLCGPEDIHRHKTEAVRDSVVANTAMSNERIVCNTNRLTPELAFELTPTHDIIIDATADYAVEWLLQELCLDLDITVVHVGIHRHGGLIRIDRTSRYADRELTLPLVPAIEGGPKTIREVGCIDPISPTPPHVVHAASAYATASALDAMTGRWALPDSVIHVMEPQPDEPYTCVGAVTVPEPE